MSVHDAIGAVPTTASGDPVVKDLLHNLLIVRYPYVFGEADDPQAWDAVDADTGSIPLAIVQNGVLFTLDPDDTTTAHDGTTTIVSNDGKRYKSEAVDFDVRSVLDKDLTAPPGSPTLGSAYIVGAAATGAWSTHDGEIAIYSSRGWVFKAEKKGLLVLVEDENSYYHYSAASAWTAGVGQSALSENSVLPANVVGGRTHWVVVNQTTNTPPGSPTTGVAYIVGGSPTGDWSGHTGKVALYNGSSWTILTPAEGWTAYDQALNSRYDYSGSAWESQAGAIVGAGSSGWQTPPSTSSGGSGNYTYLAGTQATLTPSYSKDTSAIATFATVSGRRIVFGYQLTTSTTRTNAFALFRDNETTAIDTVGRVARDGSGGMNQVNFEIIASDNASHTYYVVHLQISANAVEAPARSRLTYDIYA